MKDAKKISVEELTKLQDEKGENLVLSMPHIDNRMHAPAYKPDMGLLYFKEDSDKIFDYTLKKDKSIKPYTFYPKSETPQKGWNKEYTYYLLSGETKARFISKIMLLSLQDNEKDKSE